MLSLSHDLGRLNPTPPPKKEENKTLCGYSFLNLKEYLWQGSLSFDSNVQGVSPSVLEWVGSIAKNPFGRELLLEPNCYKSTQKQLLLGQNIPTGVPPNKVSLQQRII